jgi:succinate-semialdehyde dehydrogenase / glutarate-semialdehyde dehydrogenase
VYPDISLHIDGGWTKSSGGRTIPVVNPATGEEIGSAPHAEAADLERAAQAAGKGFQSWRKVSAFERYKLMRKAAENLRSRAEAIARIMTLEQGKPIAEAKLEILNAADVIDWFAEEGRRAYGWVIPARAEGFYQLAVKEPVGPVAAFTPWNFPINQAVRKVSAALAAGCSIILKGAEDTPASVAEFIRCFVDAGVAPGVVNLVYGTPAEVSEYLIPHPIIRKISFTGSTAVGKHLASLAGKYMKRVTMELGGHAPGIVFEDADVDQAVKVLAGGKFRNAGQVCIAPTRLLVQEPVYERFVDKFTAAAKAIKVGDGLDPSTKMGPLVRSRRVDAMEEFVGDAKAKGARVRAGGNRIGNKGFFFEPTVMTEVPPEAKMMNEEPFGPVALIAPFKDFEGAVSEANRLPYGLAAYAFTKSAKTAAAVGAAVQSGMVAINNAALALPEVPFGGVKDSGYGTEGGAEAIEAYLNTKFITQTGV